MQLADFDQQLVFVEAQCDGCAIDGQQVARVEAAHQLGEHLGAVDLEQHPIEVALHDDTFEVGVVFQGVAQFLGLSVLQHDSTVLVVKVGECEGALRQVVEEFLLGVAVVGHRLVVVEVVVGEVGEDAASEVQSGDAVLRHAV